MALGEDLVASFVDVPGHERFVRNMLAGAHGVDAVILVVAADESVMPQTREHFEICRLLGVPRGLVALTKCDAADAALADVAEAEVKALVAGSFLEGAPVVRVSSRTGTGLGELRATLVALAHAAPERASDGPMRLPIDRVFTMKGFGTVVTGTLVAGSLGVGDELEVQPSGRRARARGLQVHGAAAERVHAGTRTAVNLSGTETFELERGFVLAHPGTLWPTSILDVELVLLDGARPLADGARVRVHLASAERLARVRLLEPGPLVPGRRALAQLRLESRAVAGRHDRLVIRSYSPAATIGGARVIDPLPPKRRQEDLRALERLVASASPAAAALAMLEEAGPTGLDVGRLAARLTITAASLASVLDAGADIVSLGSDGALLVARSALARLEAAALETVAAYHRDQPLRSGIPREELRARAFGASDAAVFETVLAALEANGRVVLAAGVVRAAGHEVRLAPREEEAREALLSAAATAGLAGIELAALAKGAFEPTLLQRVVRVLVAEKSLACVGTAVYVSCETLNTLKTHVRSGWPSGAKLDVGAFKDLTGLTRKHAIPLLEYLDRERVTRRVGADRIVI
jgi:selenocysteine-specific elongation factor